MVTIYSCWMDMDAAYLIRCNLHLRPKAGDAGAHVGFPLGVLRFTGEPILSHGLAFWPANIYIETGYP